MASRKQQRVCRLCGSPFYSNKKIYCSPDHCRIWNTMLRGGGDLAALLDLLIQRDIMGARIEGLWVNILLKHGWLKRETDGFTVFTQVGWERLELLLKARKERRNGQRKAKDNRL